MFDFIFNLTSDLAILNLSPQNTFTEIDSIANIFGIERYNGESYKDFYDFYNTVSVQGQEGSVKDIVQIVSRAEIFTISALSNSTNKVFGIEVTGNSDLIIRSDSFVGGIWQSTSSTYDLTNRKIYPYLNDLILKTKEDFSDLEWIITGIETESNYSITGMNLYPDKNFRRSFFSPADTMVSIPSNILPSSLRYNSSLFALNTSSVFSSGFYLDHHLNRLYCSTDLINNLVISFEEVNSNHLFKGSKNVFSQSFSSTEAFVKMIQNESFITNRHVQLSRQGETRISTEITSLNETPHYLRFFDEEIGLRYRSR